MSDELRALRNVASLAVGREQRARLVEAVAGEQEPIDAQLPADGTAPLSAGLFKADQGACGARNR
jgi:hypothetical protein